jgi:hypothetical protein
MKMASRAILCASFATTLYVSGCSESRETSLPQPTYIYEVRIHDRSVSIRSRASSATTLAPLGTPQYTEVREGGSDAIRLTQHSLSSDARIAEFLLAVFGSTSTGSLDIVLYDAKLFGGSDIVFVSEEWTLAETSGVEEEEVSEPRTMTRIWHGRIPKDSPFPYSMSIAMQKTDYWGTLGDLPGDSYIDWREASRDAAD